MKWSLNYTAILILMVSTQMGYQGAEVHGVNELQMLLKETKLKILKEEDKHILWAVHTGTVLYMFIVIIASYNNVVWWTSEIIR